MFIGTGLEKAYRVLGCIYKEEKFDREDSSFCLNAFSNCREQGFSLMRNDRQVAFSENRNSDNIIVYWGTIREFDISTNHPEKWENKKYFSYNAYEETAEWIVGFLKGRHDGEK